jgi:hypothetical protein
MDALVVRNRPVVLRDIVLLAESVVNFVVGGIPANDSEDVGADQHSQTV